MSFRHPPNGSSAAAKKWIAVDALFPVGKAGAVRFKAAKGFAVLMLVAAQIVLIEQRRIERDSRKEPRSQQEDA